MDRPREGPPDKKPTATELLARAVADVAAPGPHAPKGDLIEGLQKLERALDRYWEEGQPSGDGAAYRDRILEIWLDRLDAKARNEVRAERLWLLGKAGAATLVFVAVSGYLA